MQSVDVLLQPVVSEKAVAATTLGKYVFFVAIHARKEEIKKAVEAHYNVNVTSISTAMFRTSPRRQTKRRVENTAKLSKKAYVTLQKGQTLHLLEVTEE